MWNEHHLLTQIIASLAVLNERLERMEQTMATQDDVNRLSAAVNANTQAVADLTITTASVVTEVQNLHAQGAVDLGPATAAVESSTAAVTAADANLKALLPAPPVQ